MEIRSGPTSLGRQVRFSWAIYGIDKLVPNVNRSRLFGQRVAKWTSVRIDFGEEAVSDLVGWSINQHPPQTHSSFSCWRLLHVCIPTWLVSRWTWLHLCDSASLFSQPQELKLLGDASHESLLWTLWCRRFVATDSVRLQTCGSRSACPPLKLQEQVIKAHIQVGICLYNAKWTL